jgi:5-oxoprolinase (ATP-hydrolysing)
VVRELEFLRPLAAGILSERRALAPFGLAGGGPGAKGLNLLIRAGSGRTVNLGGKATVAVAAGDRIIIHTPGAGGYGAPTEDGDNGSGAKAGAPPAPAPALRGSVNEYRLRQEGA